MGFENPSTMTNDELADELHELAHSPELHNRFSPENARAYELVREVCRRPKPELIMPEGGF